MRIHTLAYIIACLLPMGGTAQENGKDYLRKVLANLKEIRSAEYACHSEGYQPGDTLPILTHEEYYKEMEFPQDTAYGCLFMNAASPTFDEMGHAYDGTQRYIFYPEKRGVIIDDFTYRKLPFRPMSPPFFHYGKSLIEYMLTTDDNIRIDRQEKEDTYYFKLTVDEEEQIEFFGKATHMPKPPFPIDPVSVYELWISKHNDLPYRIRRDMSHDISVVECRQAEFNRLSVADFDIEKYIPEDYERRTPEENARRHRKEPQELTGKPAPTWTLNNADSIPVSIGDFKGKVLVLCVTGIGCGACQAAVPFLKELETKFPSGTVNLIAIESWSRRESAVKAYVAKKQLSYPVLVGTDAFIEAYQTGGSAPWFFILDENRVIRKSIRGYSSGKTDQEIVEGIAALL